MIGIDSSIRRRALLLALALGFCFAGSPALAASAIPGEVACDKGVDMPKVQALVKRTAAALDKSMDAVIGQINHGDGQWKDGSLYMVVFRNTTLLAHGYLPQYVGTDLSSTTYANNFQWVKSASRMALERGQGCIEYRFHNPAKGGAIEDKVTYVLKVSDSVWAGSGTYLVK